MSQYNARVQPTQPYCLSNVSHSRGNPISELLAVFGLRSDLVVLALLALMVTRDPVCHLLLLVYLPRYCQLFQMIKERDHLHALTCVLICHLLQYCPHFRFCILSLHSPGLGCSRPLLFPLLLHSRCQNRLYQCH